MKTYENRVREFAHQIWESEGRPIGHEYRHWQMACKLVEGLNNQDDIDGLGSGHVLSVIAVGDAHMSDPEIDPTPPVVEPDIPANPPPIHEPIQPTDPVQPGNPTKPVQPQANRKRNQTIKRKKVIKELI